MLMGALYYAHHGIPVFPFWIPSSGSEAGRKIPCVKDWPNAASTDTRQIQAWWSKGADYCGSLIGALTGERSGWGVIDVDVKHGGKGMQSLATLADEITPVDISHLTYGGLAPEHRLASTGLVQTRSGGLHLWYPLGKHATARGVGQIRDLPDIEFKATGQYVAVAPSTGYEWLSMLPVRGDESISEYFSGMPTMSEKLLARVIEKAPAGNGKGKGGSESGGSINLPHYLTHGIPMGDQDNTLRSISASLARRRFSAHEIVGTLRAIVDISDQDPTKPWTDKHLEDKARRAVDFINKQRDLEAVSTKNFVRWARELALNSERSSA
jgi:hypothetical protein